MHAAQLGGIARSFAKLARPSEIIAMTGSANWTESNIRLPAARNPNAAIDANFVNYQVVTRSGKSATGLIAAETAASITLRRAENQTEVILRQDIEEMRSSGQSLMPEGLEKVINVAQMADLLAGRWYVNVHTAAHPGGEIRGQVTVAP